MCQVLCLRGEGGTKVKPHGYGGKILRVDLTTGKLIEEPTEKYAKEWIGGRGINEWILFNEHLTAAVGPWGVSFSANLTPDEETGIGDWTEEEFIGAVRTGTHRGIGRPILPPMPWFNLAMATDEDLQAIFAYLQSIPAVANQVPDAIEPPAM